MDLRMLKKKGFVALSAPAPEGGTVGGGQVPEGEVHPLQPHDRQVSGGPHLSLGEEVEGGSGPTLGQRERGVGVPIEGRNHRP